MPALRIALIASARFAIREPFAGGLEAHTWALARGLTRCGHEVTVFAGAGCDPELGARELTATRLRISAAARADVSMSRQTRRARAPSVEEQVKTLREFWHGTPVIRFSKKPGHLFRLR